MLVTRDLLGKTVHVQNKQPVNVDYGLLHTGCNYSGDVKLLAYQWNNSNAPVRAYDHYHMNPTLRIVHDTLVVIKT